MERPLSGIRAIGLEQYIAGPYCTLLLADAGAEIIKVERPGKGDPRRSMPPFAEKEGKRKAAGFMSYNRNKKSLALNLQHLEGQKIFHELATTADVVVENLRPGAMDKIGLNYSNLSSSHTRLIWAIISGFGQLKGYRGPYSDRPAFDIVAEAMSGIMQALFMRERTGKGQLIDSAMFDNMLSLNESMVALHSVAGQSPMRGTPKNLFPRGAFKTKDGYIALNVPDNIIWERLCKAINRNDMIEDPRCKTGVERAANAHYIQPIIEVWLEQLTRDDAVKKLNSSGVPTGPINTAEDIFSDPHVNARGLLMPITDSEVGKHLFARSPPFLSEAPTLPTESAPKLGEHTIEILTEVLGYSGEKINELSEGGVIGH